MIPWPKVEESLRKVLDPEVGVNIVDLGLINEIESDEDEITVKFVLTYPGCPMGPEIADDIINTLTSDFGVSKVKALITWEPPWYPERMTEEARFAMGYPI